MTAVRHRIRVTGVVQGVGFRPFVHRLARESGLVGFVRNDAGHVHIEVEGPAPAVDRFEERLRTDAPPLARVDTLAATTMDRCGDADFAIAVSESATAAPPVIPPDAAVCADCLAELFDPADRRHRYPFITCTNCGPRFTIVTAMPYDRPHTTMGGFELCPACAAEYADPDDRRHHAQPLACPSCGPVLAHEQDGVTTARGDDAIGRVQDDLAAGRIVAVKGIGGYHLAVDAKDDAAVRRLRSRKARPDKPFAVMVPDLATADEIAVLDDAARAALTAAANPVVLLRARQAAMPAVAPAVAPGSPLIGVMLPSTPLHHLLFACTPDRAAPPRVLVMTSGNLSEEPICFSDDDARRRLTGIADSFCTHDRPIHAPCDDSVARVIGGDPVPLRRSRGQAPLPLTLPIDVPPILAMGGDIKNVFAVARDRAVWLSQHLGDMVNRETVDAFEASVRLFTAAHQVAPTLIAVDAHPGYRSHRWAVDHADGAHVVRVQHHHAHLAALMAEHGMVGDRPVVGFVFDGTGHGTDGTAWGGEILAGSYDTVERWGHLLPVDLPGGDSAARNPCRSALAHLRAAGVAWTDDLAPVRACAGTERRVLDAQLRSDRLGVPSSSMGRLFDAVASLLDLRHRISYEAQAAIELEILAAEADDAVPLRFGLHDVGRFDAAPVLTGVVRALRGGADRATIALGFHHAVVALVAEAARRVRTHHGCDVVGLTGGVWQNAVLAELARSRLEADGFAVLTHRLVPSNDGGLALGQVMVAAHTRGEGTCASVSQAR